MSTDFKDLFEYYEEQPIELKKVTDKWVNIFYSIGLGDGRISEFKKEVEELGYTFDYDMDLEPFALRLKK